MADRRVLEEYRFDCRDGGVHSVQFVLLFGAYQVVDAHEQVCWLDDPYAARLVYAERLQLRREQYQRGEL